MPNLPLLVALGALLVAALTHGSVHSHARAIFYVGLSAWGWLELTSGANLVRRAIGVAALVYVVVKISS